MTRPFISNVIGFDDFPFPRPHRGDVRVGGVVVVQFFTCSEFS